MYHFTRDDGLYLFRIPTGWQFLVNYKLGGPLDENYMSNKYDPLLRACLDYGGYCIIYMHNYGHYLDQNLNGGIIGQPGGGPTNAQFTSVWRQLAKRYANESKVIFGIMNEPHDLDINKWATTCQLVVNAIRAAGAKTQLILIPGSEYSSAPNFPYYSGPALLPIKDFDGSQNMLIFDIHRYYDQNGYGQLRECVQNHIQDSYAPLAQYLRQYGRQAMITETGGGNTQSCVKYVCQALDYLDANSDVYLGWVGWAAGAFKSNCKLKWLHESLSTDI